MKRAMGHIADSFLLDPIAKIGRVALTPEAILKCLAVLLLSFVAA